MAKSGPDMMEDLAGRLKRLLVQKQPTKPDSEWKLLFDFAASYRQKNGLSVAGLLRGLDLPSSCAQYLYGKKPKRAPSRKNGTYGQRLRDRLRSLQAGTFVLVNDELGAWVENAQQEHPSLTSVVVANDEKQFVALVDLTKQSADVSVAQLCAYVCNNVPRAAGQEQYGVQLTFIAPSGKRTVDSPACVLTKEQSSFGTASFLPLSDLLGECKDARAAIGLTAAHVAYGANRENSVSNGVRVMWAHTSEHLAPPRNSEPMTEVGLCTPTLLGQEDFCLVLPSRDVGQQQKAFGHVRFPDAEELDTLKRNANSSTVFRVMKNGSKTGVTTGVVTQWDQHLNIRSVDDHPFAETGDSGSLVVHPVRKAKVTSPSGISLHSAASTSASALSPLPPSSAPSSACSGPSASPTLSDVGADWEYVVVGVLAKGTPSMLTTGQLSSFSEFIQQHANDAQLTQKALNKLLLAARHLSDAASALDCTLHDMDFGQRNVAVACSVEHIVVMLEDSDVQDVILDWFSLQQVENTKQAQPAQQ